MVDIIYIKVDEVLELVFVLFLLIICFFVKVMDLIIGMCDIFFVGCVLVVFLDFLSDEQKQLDDFVEFGQMVKQLDVNVIKLLNIFVFQLQFNVVIKELQDQGFKLLDYLVVLVMDVEKDIKVCYDVIKGLVVNLVLCEGNFDCCVLKVVKEYVKKNLYWMGVWVFFLKIYVVIMGENDFCFNEKFIMVFVIQVGIVMIVFVFKDGVEIVLKGDWLLEDGDVIDVIYMDMKVFLMFLEKEIEDVKDQGILFFVYLKVIMMKVFDLIIFGVCVKVFLKDVFEKYVVIFVEFGVNLDFGIGDLDVKVVILLVDKVVEI